MALTRSIGAYDDGTVLAPGVGTTPLDTRKSLSALWASAGVVAGGPSPLVTGTTGFAYQVAGPVPFVTTRGPSDGFQMFTNDGAASVTCPGAPGSGLQRIDIVWVRHPTNTENSDTSSAPIFGVASGTAVSSSPAAPSIPTGALELARNTMTSAATSTASTGNTISQTAAVAALRGAPVPFRNQAERDAYPSPYDGLQGYRLDTHVTETYNGTAWIGGAWTVATGLAVPGANANYVVVRHHTVIGKTVRMAFRFVASVGFAPGTGEIIIPLPVNADTSVLLVGTFTFYDASTGNKVTGYVQLANATQATCRYVVTQNGYESAMTPTGTPVLWADGDTLEATLTYEAV